MGCETSDSRVFDMMVQEAIDDGDQVIRILAEGDSWFAYPRQFILFGEDSNVIDQLADRDELFILNTASNGDEATDMLSGAQKFSFLKKLRHMDFDMVLFSGGGNDIVGRYDFGTLIKTKGAGMGWMDCINHDRVARKIQRIKLAYQELLELVDDVEPGVKVVTHTYDFAVPSTKGFELFDLIPVGKSWIKPYCVNKGITDTADQKNIIKHILTEFKNELLSLENDHANLKVVDTQGLLDDHHWRNEIHPTPDGFDIIANAIYNQGILN